MKKIILLQIIALLILIPVFSFAQGTTNIPTPTGPGADRAFVECGFGDKPACTINDLIGPDGLVQRGLNLIFMFAGFIAAIMFMYAGFLLITAAGDAGQITRAKGVFKNVIIGFVIMLAAVVLVKQLLTYLGAAEFFQKIIQ
jgi:hypothetical protein